MGDVWSNPINHIVVLLGAGSEGCGITCAGDPGFMCCVFDIYCNIDICCIIQPQ